MYHEHMTPSTSALQAAVRRLVDSGLVSETRLRDGSIGDCVRVLSPEWEAIIGGVGA